jgi:2-polyprenyl-3-methyl-5-hydroxy-6-metoxy-1,4-benzoquinol methylase
MPTMSQLHLVALIVRESRRDVRLPAQRPRILAVNIMGVRIDPEKSEPAALTGIGADFAGMRVLEVGCGDGRLTKTFADRARAVVAIDPEPSAAADFPRAAWPPHVEFRAVGLEAFESAGRHFDVVLFSWSL